MANTKINSDVINDNAITTSKIANDAITNDKIAANSVNAEQLNVSSNGTAGQFLASDGDGSMTWTTQTPGIGVGQSWQDVTGSRSDGVTYTNTTGRPIQAMIQLGTGSGGNSNTDFNLVLNGITIQAHGMYAGTDVGLATFIIPNGNTYRIDIINANNATIGKWLELR